jgi:hypothetical protein
MVNQTALKTILSNNDLRPMREWSLRIRNNHRNKHFKTICEMVNTLLNLLSGGFKIAMLKSKIFIFTRLIKS